MAQHLAEIAVEKRASFQASDIAVPAMKALTTGKSVHTTKCLAEEACDRAVQNTKDFQATVDSYRKGLEVLK